MSLSEKALLVKEDFDNLYDAGKQAGSDEMWRLRFDTTKTTVNLAYAFYWSVFEYIRPPFKLVGSNAQYTFSSCLKLKKIEKDYFNFSKMSPSQTSGSHLSHTFYCCEKLQEIEDIGLPAGYYDNTFRSCLSLEKIEVLRFKKTTKVNNQYWIDGCSKLKDLTIEGEIGTTIYWQYASSLTVESLISIITHLYNYAGTTSEGTYSITLASASKTKLAAEGATSPNGNTWAEYIGDLGWVLK